MLSSTDAQILLDTPRIKVRKPRGPHPDKRLTRGYGAQLKKARTTCGRQRVVPGG